MISPDDVRAAARRLGSHVRRTPTMTLPAGTFGAGRDLSVKLELLQVTGTFKARGAFNTLLSAVVPGSGVCAASGGNHGVAVAHAAATLGHRATIFVPEIASPAKTARIRACGADLVIGGERYADALRACDDFVARTGALPIAAYDAWPTLAGQGTVAKEWEEDAVGGLDTVLVAVGGGGLAAGMARWFDGRVRVVGVEPEGSCALHAALRAGGPIDVPVDSVAADSLGARNVGPRVHEVAARWMSGVVLVTDAAILDAQRRAWRELRLATEPGGATALAALLSGAYRPAPDERLGVLFCGANVELGALASIVG